MKDYVFRPRTPRRPKHTTLTCTYYENRDRTVPMLRLRGLWLEEMGWKTGSRLNIEVEDERIVITLGEPAPPPPVRKPPRPTRLTRRLLARRAIF